MALSAAAVLLGLLAVLALAITVGGGRPAPPPAGLPDPGAVTGWGLPVSQLLTRLAAVGTVGTLLFAAVLAPSADGRLRGAALRAVRAASWWALGWAGATLAGGVLTVSSLYGVPVTALTPSAMVGFIEIGPGQAAAGVVVLSVVIAAAARRCTGAVTASALLALGLVAVVLPAVLAGHAASAANHVLATTSLSVHVVSAALWVGGLLALVVNGRASTHLALAAGRFSTLALACFVAAGGSGLLNAWVMVGGSPGAVGRALGTGYGSLLVAKLVALIVLGGFGWWHRRHTLRQLEMARPRAFGRFAAVEVCVLLATVALAVALAASPPPATASASGTDPAATAPPATGSAAADQDGATPDQEPAGEAVPSQDMSGHDHGDLSVGVFVDDTRFHVSEPVSPGELVTVYNESGVDVTITAQDGSFDAVAPGQAFVTFAAPDQPGEYVFTSEHSPEFRDVLVVR